MCIIYKEMCIDSIILLFEKKKEAGPVFGLASKN